MPFVGLIVCSRALLGVAHYNEWYPEQQLARAIIASPTLLQIEWVRWTLLAILTVLLWAVVDYFVYQRKHAWLRARFRRRARTRSSIGRRILPTANTKNTSRAVRRGRSLSLWVATRLARISTRESAGRPILDEAIAKARAAWKWLKMSADHWRSE